MTTMFNKIFERKTREFVMENCCLMDSNDAADTLLPGIATEKGHIVVDESYAASIPGVFAAGDCTGAPYQIPAAVGEGNRAALSVVRWLRNA